MLSKFDLDTIRVALEEAKEMAPAQWAGDGGAKLKEATDALAALDRLIEAEKCNGWSNWETWNVKLWLDNDIGTVEAVRDLTTDFKLEDGTLAEAIKDLCEAICLGDEPPANMATDMLNGALGAVNWQEIASAVADEIAEG